MHGSYYSLISCMGVDSRASQISGENENDYIILTVSDNESYNAYYKQVKHLFHTPPTGWKKYVHTSILCSPLGINLKI